MFGTGPMLPVLPLPPSPPPRSPSPLPHSTTSSEHSRRFQTARHPRSRSLRAFIASTNTAMSNKVKSSSCAISRVPPYQRSFSLDISWDAEKLKQVAQAIEDGTLDDPQVSLFVYWLRESSANFELAKKHVRLLSVDQFYPIERAETRQARKLLLETRELRPMPPQHAVSAKAFFKKNVKKCKSMGVLTTLSTSSKAMSTPPLPTAPPLPGFPIAAVPSPTSSATITPTVATFAAVSPVTTTPTVATIPRTSSRLAEDYDSRPMSQPTGGFDGELYPPLTADRPAPLSIKSRSSNSSQTSDAKGMTPRSVSTPVRKNTFRSSGNLPRASVLMRDMFSHPLMSPSGSSSFAESDHYTPDFDNAFETKDKKNGSRSDTFADSRVFDADQTNYVLQGYKHSASGRSNPLKALLVESSEHDVTSSTFYDQSFRTEALNRTYDTLNGTSLIGDDSFADVMDLYADGPSALETSSSPFNEQKHTVYKYASSSPSFEEVSMVADSPTMGQVYSGSQNASRSSTSPVPSFHHPLHCNQDASETQLSTSVPVNHGVPGLKRHCDESNTDGWPLPFDSRGTSGTISLDAFPIPPMQNPAGELPMLISRAMMPSSSANWAQVDETDLATTDDSILDTYRAITKVQMIRTLKKTRAEGAKRHRVAWKDMKDTEKFWRQDNEKILISIWGHPDVELSQADVEYVNCIAQETTPHGDHISANDWVHRAFGDII